MKTTKSKAISSLSGYMYFTDISIVNSGVREAYAHVYHLVKSILCVILKFVWFIISQCNT